LVSVKFPIPDPVTDLYTRHMNKLTRPSLEEISKVLHSVTALFSRVFIIVDALDECQVTDGRRFLNGVFHLQAECGANLFATSRFTPEITEMFKGSVTLEIRASDEDVRSYLDGHMFQLPSFVRRNPELREEIMTSIVPAVDGMCVPLPLK